ncbi:MAG: transketolase [Chloroflexi bacterium]|nr:transketolase [Chloroflexota bacterium]
MKELQMIACNIREDIVRTARDCSEGVHAGGSLSMAEILSVLFFHVMSVDPARPDWPERDRFVLSKGHGNVGLSAAMARKGFFPLEDLKRFDQLGAPLSMHIDKHRMPGVEVSSGSLGHGLPIAVGMAMAGKLDQAAWKVYCIMGDGELMEGSMWEALMAAAHYKLKNLTGIIDRNHFSLDGPTEEIMGLEPLVEKVQAFGWRVIEVDGHDVSALLAAFADDAPGDERPKMIVANTIKGKGISFLENKTSSHFAHFKPEQAEQALQDLAEARAKIQ